MKKSLSIYIALIFVSCSTFNSETEVKNSLVTSYKNSAILFRLGKSTPVTKQEFEANLTNWIGGFQKNNKLLLLNNEAYDKIGNYDSGANRFYQMSEEKQFLTHKSRGTFATFYHNNEEMLRNIFKENNLDSMIIYEIESFYSPVMNYMDFSSLIIIFDINGNISYLDHQFDTYRIDEFFPDPAKLKGNLIDKVSERMIEKLLSFGYMEESNHTD